jgi:thioredoxin 1
MTSASLPAKRQTAPELPSQPLKPPTASGAAARPQTAPAREETPPPPPAHLPQLIELGSKTCVPCKMMAPILDELRRDFSGRLEVIFYDIYERRDMAEAYRIRVIPTQVFLDVEGKEFFRHQGFYPKDEVLARFREHGITLESK